MRARVRAHLVPRVEEVGVFGEEEAEGDDLGHHLAEEERGEGEVELLEGVRELGGRVEPRRVEREADRRDDDRGDHQPIEGRVARRGAAQPSEGVARPKEE